MRVILDSIKGFGAEEQRRILRWVSEKLNLPQPFTMPIQSVALATASFEVNPPNRIEEVPPKNLLSSADAANVLDICARVKMDSKNITAITIDQEQANSINELVYMTKAAIVINWLRVVGKNRQEVSRAKAVLADFERKTLDAVPPEARSSLARRMEVLVTKTTELREIAENAILTQSEMDQAIAGWCKGWLGLACRGDAFLRRTSIQYGRAFSTHLDRAMGSLFESVQAVLFEEVN